MTAGRQTDRHGQPPTEEASQDKAARTRSLAGGGAVVLIGQLAGKGFRLLFRFLAAQLLGPASYGLVVLGITFSDLASRLGMLGFDRVALRHGAQHVGQKDFAAWRATLRFCLGMGAIGGGIAGLILFLFAPTFATHFNKPDLAKVLQIVALGVPLMSLGGVSVGALQSVQRTRDYALWGFMVASMLGCATLGLVWAFDLGLEGVAYAWAGGAIIAGLGAVASAWRHKRQEKTSILPRGPMVRFALTMLVFMGAAQLVHQIDRLMVGALRSSEEVGVYDIAAILASHIPIFLTALNAVVFPKIGAAWHAGKRDEVKALFQLETRWVVMLSAPLFMGLALLRGPLMSLFGDGFAVGATAIAILSLAQLINASAGPVGGVLMMTDKERWVLFNTLLLGGLNTVGNALLIPRYGIIGASISTACALACWNLVALAQVWWFYKIQPYNKHYLRPVAFFLASLGLGFGLDFALPAPWGPWVATTVALIVYAGLTLTLGLQPEDKQLGAIISKKLGR